MDPNATANAHFAPRVSTPPFAAATTVSSESLRVFAIGAEARGLDPATVLAASGIDPSILGRPGARVGGPSVADAWTRACERFRDQLFPLTIGDALPMGAIAPLDYLVLSSANIVTALGHVIRYAPILSDTEILSLTLEGNEAHLRYQNRNRVPYHIEMIAGVFARRARDMFGPNWALKRVCFMHSALGPRATYDRVCQAPVLFDMPCNEVVFARELTEMPMPGADARLNTILVNDAEAALAAVGRPASAPSFIDMVKRVLEEGLNQRDLTLVRLADQLGVSARTLQRRLRAAGVTHRGLVRAVRQDVADRSLVTRASQRQIARTLGYSGAGAFQRAFKRWSGMTPGQHRRKPAKSP